MENKKILSLLNAAETLSLKSTDNNWRFPAPKDIKLEDIVFFRVDKITFDEKAPRKEAFENVLSSLRFPDSVNFLFLIKGDVDSVNFYFGLSRDLNDTINDSLPIKTIGENILRPSLEGNFRGSELVELEGENEAEKIALIKAIKDKDVFSFHRQLEGIPGMRDEKKYGFQSVDRLVDVMLGDEFMFLITSRALSNKKDYPHIEKCVNELYNQLVPISKESRQTGYNESKSQGSSSSSSETHSTQQTNGTNESNSQSKNIPGETESIQRSTTTKVDDNKSKTESHSFPKESITTQTSKGTSTSNSVSSGNSQTTGTSCTESKGENTAITRECLDKTGQDWVKYLGETLTKRLDYGKGKGVFISSVSLFAKDNIIVTKLGNTAVSLFSSETDNKEHLKTITITDAYQSSIMRNFQIPFVNLENKLINDEVNLRIAKAQYAFSDKIYIANWMTSNELSIIAGLPQKEVVGLSLREEVEFGLNCEVKTEGDVIPLGCLVQSGKLRDKIPVNLAKSSLNKHIFVCGVTGAGKTTTCQKILLESQLPYFVIEPAKTEYRILAKGQKDVLVFTLGNEKLTPFRLNPLEFLPSETISSHIDMVKASIEAAFDMEAAIPQIIESSLYECYKDKGWDIDSNENAIYGDKAFDDGVYAFPTISDLIAKTETEVKKQNFGPDGRLAGDYIGSIKARLQGLTLGAKGQMLNTHRSINFRDLVHKKVVIELEQIKSASEKSLIMGFILSNLTEAIKAEFYEDKEFKHITLVEEAHRLLSKYEPGDSMNKKNGVETFSDMLSEIRKYGESLIIADQIPSKMAPDVIKNTNTKIVHKIFAQDDKEAIGNTMALSDEQKKFLSSLGTGRCVVFSQGWEKSVQAKVTMETDTSKEFINPEVLKDIVYDYYINNYKSGIFPFIACMSKKPTKEQFAEVMKASGKIKRLREEYINLCKSTEASSQLLSIVKDLLMIATVDDLSSYIVSFYKEKNEAKENMIKNLIEELRSGSENLRSFFSQGDNQLLMNIKE